MTRGFLIIPLLALLPAAAQAACYADYKAKQDDPLRLSYGVAEIAPPCTAEAATEQLAPRLEAAGWVLLSVVSTFDASGLEERKTRAGEHYLSF